MATKKFTLVEFNEDTLAVELSTTTSPKIIGVLNFTDRDGFPPAYNSEYKEHMGDEDDQSNEWKLLRVLGWEHTPLPYWQHDLIVAAMHCQMRRDDFTGKHRSMGDWFMAGAVHQSEILLLNQTVMPFQRSGLVFGERYGREHNNLQVCQKASAYGWMPEDGTGYYEFTTESAGGYIDEALAYLNEHCCAPGLYLGWVGEEVLVLDKPEEEAPF